MTTCHEIWTPAAAPHALLHSYQGYFDNITTKKAASGGFLKMTTGSICIPKENTRDPRGEDAHFISPEFQTIGVADGVGGWWIKERIDAGKYARQLMMNCILALNVKSRGATINPKSILEEAYYNTTAEGSSTACVVSLCGDTLRAANVGDSGFMVIRGGEVVYRSPTQQRKFNCPYQLGRTRDNPTVAEEIQVAVQGGDVVVAGSDGLWDNVHASEVAEIVRRGTTEAGNDLAEQACYLANLALYNSFDKYWDSPYSTAARDAGKCCRGGKVDDITVIIARIDQQW